MAFETVHTDTRGITVTPITTQRQREHDRKYTKPRPANWWDWHCEVCNAPITDEPR